MKKFCENPLCELNKFDYNGYNKIRIPIDNNKFEYTFNTKIVENFLYRNKSKTVEFFLCETCHNAVKLTEIANY